MGGLKINTRSKGPLGEETSRSTTGRVGGTFARALPFRLPRDPPKVPEGGSATCCSFCMVQVRAAPKLLVAMR